MPDNTNEFRKRIEKLETTNEKQAKYAEKQYRMSQVTAASSILILLIVLYTAITVTPKVNLLLRDIQISVSNIQRVSQDLSDADLPQMIDNIDSLVDTSESSIQTATDKLNAIDIESLNSAIRDLANIVRPLGKLFGN